MKTILTILITLALVPISDIAHNAYFTEKVDTNVIHFEKIFYNLWTGKPKLGILGTGVQINYHHRQYILTNKHVCEGGMDRKGYMLADGLKRKVIAISKIHDLCLVEPIIYRSGLELADGVNSLEPLWLIGHPRGLALTRRRANYIATETEEFPWIGPMPVEYYFINVVSYGGNSGSPVVNYVGNVVGLLFGGYRGFHTEAFVVPVHSIKFFLDTRL